MTRKLILIAAAALGIVWSVVSEAKVCRLGDEGCETSEFFGVGDAQCDASYKPCSDPRAGATYCYGVYAGSDTPQALYRDEDCCSSLKDNSGYLECFINEGKAGYGLSCHGAVSNTTYWQYCGCSYGFVEVDENGVPNGGYVEDLESNPRDVVPYESRCGQAGWGFGDCQFAQCNEDRRFFYEDGGAHCKYRLGTRCGGFGCMQVYDCNHDEVDDGSNGVKEYYRNENDLLANGLQNFIPFYSEDFVSNERIDADTVKLILSRSNAEPVQTDDYNVVNRFVCRYELEDGSKTNHDVEDNGGGFKCNTVPNYCYLWDGCNEDRRWYNSSSSRPINAGAIYNADNLYQIWLNVVEKDADYHPEHVHAGEIPQHINFYKNPDIDNQVNPGYGIYEPIDGSIDGKNLSNCTVDNGCIIDDKGCTYIRGDCHRDGAEYSNHRCWKKVSCTEENRFYASFMNAATISVDRDGNILGELNNLYEASLNAPYYDAFYGNLDADEVYPACVYEINNCNDASGCYRKSLVTGCIDDFEDIRQHLTIEEDWRPWFEALYPLCNDSTRCYKATACDLAMGAYSSEPNTLFFQTISSTATGLTCYKGVDCSYEYGAYSSEPNTSFFSNINSLATGSVCYRGETCHLDAGAYSSEPNLYFFKVIESEASGSKCYRGAMCLGLDNGAYTSEPNTSFFNIIGSAASSSTCYRGTSCNFEAGAYSSEPNTLFFKLSDSSASGSACYRGDSCYFEIGVYSSEPNTSFFENINSLASGSTCYRGQNCNEEVGAYTSTPNTLFFKVADSLASGSTCYRGEECDIVVGAYSSEPNTLFFNVVDSIASGSACYRGEECNVAVGAYTSEPNTSFFELIDSHASGSVCYRGDSCHIDAGAYSSSPNTLFFFVFSSTASGSTCYRGTECLEKDGGVYSSSPNTEFFTVIHSLASGSGCYRGESCNIAGGSYSSEPNTSFFEVINSSATGSICYRGKDCYLAVGSYITAPNEDFFNVITSEATGLSCYRGQDCNNEKGSYSSEPNTVFFVNIDSLASGSTCYRAEGCAETAVSEELKNSSFFVFVSSEASGSACYRSTACNLEVGAYSSEPNTSFFDVISSTNAKFDSTCYRGSQCNIKVGAYSSEPNTSFFTYVTSEASGSISYRVVKECIECGAYTSEPNTSFFKVITSLGSGSISYRAEQESIKAGAYSSEPNTSFFLNISSHASGSIAYRSELSHIAAGAYSSSPNPLFFNVIVSNSSGSISYRADRASSDTIETNTSFFLGIHSHASGSIAYRSEKAHLAAGAYSSTPNTSFFFVIKSEGSGSIAYRGEYVHIKAGAYTSEPNTIFFTTIHSLASGSISYRADGHCIDCGSYGSEPNTSFFRNISSKASGSTAYRAVNSCPECGAYNTSPNTSFFDVINSLATGLEAFRAQGAHIKAGAYSSEPNTSFFMTNTSLASGSLAYRAYDANLDAGSYTSSPFLTFFVVDSSHASGSICYRGAECAISAVPGTATNSSFFVYTNSEASGSICYRSSACRLEVGAYTSSPNTSFFNVLTSTNAENDSTCYRTDGCNIKAGAYSASPNTSFFKTVTSQASGSISYRAEEYCQECGAYTTTPNTSFFFVAISSASGSVAYRGESAHLKAGAYTSSPNTLFFNVIQSIASGSVSYRAESVDWLNGNYSSSPNTLFFSTISSKASGSFAYRADTAKILEGAYTSAPNTSFFIYSYSHASGIFAYRGDEIHIKAGAYSSKPNTMFFNTIVSLASGTISYRADMICKKDVCGHKDPITNEWIPHVYEEEPNTSFFNTEKSLASGSTAYRAVGHAIPAYTSSPNTSFFIVISSSASGSTAYRGEKSHIAAGAYSSTPNPLFFDVIVSHASGSVSYRAEEANFNRGAYTSKPNTSFFIGLSSHASGSTSYRTGPVNEAAGAYKVSPNTSFFYVIKSHASGSVSYRAETVHERAGAYSSAPNTLFFKVISSIASGSVSYRAEKAGSNAYEKEPNTSFFNTISSKASGSTCYRGHDCRINVGSYSSTPSTAFFKVIKSLASGSTCYRSEDCSALGKSKTEITNPFYKSDISGRYYYYTHFFNYAFSKSSGSICYRATTYCPTNTEFATYTTAPNTSYFMNVSHQDTTLSGTTGTCYVADHCHTAAGAYSAKPNDYFFVSNSMAASNVGCYRAQKCVKSAYDASPNTSFFITVSSKASGSTCFRGTKCNTDKGAYSIKPNTAYFYVIESLASGTICYRAEGCKPNEATDIKLSTSFFITTHSNSSSKDCYRGDICHQKAGAYTDAPNALFFAVWKDESSPMITCYRGSACSNYATSYRETSFFEGIDESSASGSKCYRGTSCHIKAGAYTTTPNTLFFNVKIMQQATICYRGTACNTSEGAMLEANTDTSFFDYNNSQASGIKCYRATACNIKAGAYTSTLFTEFFNYSTKSQTSTTCYRVTSCASSAEKIKNTSYFVTFNEKTRSSITCYRGTSCHIAGGAYSSAPNAMFFNVSSKTQGTTCYRGDSCNTGAGAYPSSSTTQYFNYISSKASGKECFRATSCSDKSEPTPPYFDTKDDSGVNAFCEITKVTQTGIDCYYPLANKCCKNPPCPGVNSECGKDDYEYNQYCKCCDAKLMHTGAGLTTQAQYFETKATNSFAGITCYGVVGCSEDSDINEYTDLTGCDTEYFDGIYTSCDVTCGKPRSKGRCYLDADQIASQQNYQDSVPYRYNMEKDGKTCAGLTVYKAISCNTNHNSYPAGTRFNEVKDNNGKYYDFDDVFVATSEGTKCNDIDCLSVCYCRSDKGWTKNQPSGLYVSATTDQFSSVSGDKRGASLSGLSTLARDYVESFGPSITNGMLTSEMTAIDVNANVTPLSTTLDKSFAAAPTSGATCYKKIECNEPSYSYFSQGRDYYEAHRPLGHDWEWQSDGAVENNYCAKPACGAGYTEYEASASETGLKCGGALGGIKCCKSADYFCPDYMKFDFNYQAQGQTADESCGRESKMCFEKLVGLHVDYSFVSVDGTVDTSKLDIKEGSVELREGEFDFVYNVENIATGATSYSRAQINGTCTNTDRLTGYGMCYNDSQKTITNVEAYSGNDYFTTLGCSGMTGKGGTCRTFDGIESVCFDNKCKKDGDTISLSLTNGTTTQSCDVVVKICDGIRTCNIEKCPDGYYRDVPDSKCFNYDVKTLSDGTKCYKVTDNKAEYPQDGCGAEACNSYYGNSAYNKDSSTSYYSNSKPSDRTTHKWKQLPETKCYSTICNEDNGYYQFNGSICSTLYGTKCCTCPSNYFYSATTPENDTAHIFEKSSSSEPCWTVACNEAGGYSEGRTTEDCHTLGSALGISNKTCCKTCPTGYKYFASKPSNPTSYHKYNASDYYDDCYSVGCQSGYDSSAKSSPNAVGSTYEGVACYQENIPECPEGYYYYNSDDLEKSDIFNVKKAASGNNCYSITGCKVGYLDNTTPYTNKSLTPPGYSAQVKSADGTVVNTCYKDLITAGFYLYCDGGYEGGGYGNWQFQQYSTVDLDPILSNVTGVNDYTCTGSSNPYENDKQDVNCNVAGWISTLSGAKPSTNNEITINFDGVNVLNQGNGTNGCPSDVSFNTSYKCTYQTQGSETRYFCTLTNGNEITDGNGSIDYCHENPVNFNKECALDRSSSNGVITKISTSTELISGLNLCLNGKCNDIANNMINVVSYNPNTISMNTLVYWGNAGEDPQYRSGEFNTVFNKGKPMDTSCPTGYYYYSENPNTTYRRTVHPYYYRKHSNTTKYPNCYAIECNSIEYRIINEDGVYESISRTLIERDPSEYYTFETGEGYTTPIPSEDTIANNVLPCYMPAKEPTHIVYYFDTYSSGDSKCYEAVGVDYMLAEAYINDVKYKDEEDLSDYYLISNEAGYRSCSNGELVLYAGHTLLTYNDGGLFGNSVYAPHTIQPILNCVEENGKVGAEACIYNIKDNQTTYFTAMQSNDTASSSNIVYCTKQDDDAIIAHPSASGNTPIGDSITFISRGRYDKTITYNNVGIAGISGTDSDSKKYLSIVRKYNDTGKNNIRTKDDAGWVTINIPYDIDNYKAGASSPCNYSERIFMEEPIVILPDEAAKDSLWFNIKIVIPRNISCDNSSCSEVTLTYTYEDGSGSWGSQTSQYINGGSDHKHVSLDYSSTSTKNPYIIFEGGVSREYGLRWITREHYQGDEVYNCTNYGSVSYYDDEVGFVEQYPSNYGKKLKFSNWGGRCTGNPVNPDLPDVKDECYEGDIVFDRTDPDVDRLFYSETIDDRTYSPITDFYDLTRANSKLYCLSPSEACKTTLMTYDEWHNGYDEWVGEFSEAIYNETGNYNVKYIFEQLGYMADDNGYCVKTTDRCPVGYTNQGTPPDTTYFDVEYSSSVNGTFDCWMSIECNESNGFYAYNSSTANQDCHEAYSSTGNLMKCCQKASKEYYLNCTYEVPETPSGQTYILTNTINGIPALYGEVSCSWLDGEFPISNYCTPLNRTLYIKDKEVHYGANPTSINTVNKNYKLYNDIIYQSTLNSTFVVGAGQVPLSTSSVSGVYVYDYIDNGSLYGTAKIVNEGTLYACDSNGNNCKTSATTTCSGGETVTVNYNSNYVTPPNIETTCDIGYTSMSSLILERAQWDVTKYTLSDGTICAKASCKSNAISSATTKTGYTCTKNPVTGTTPYCCIEQEPVYYWPSGYEITYTQECGIGHETERLCWPVVTGINFTCDDAKMCGSFVDRMITPSSNYITVSMHFDIDGRSNSPMTGIYTYSTDSFETGSTFSYCAEKNLNNTQCERASEITKCYLDRGTYIEAEAVTYEGVSYPKGYIIVEQDNQRKVIGLDTLTLHGCSGNGSLDMLPTE